MPMEEMPFQATSLEEMPMLEMPLEECHWKNDNRRNGMGRNAI
jgi:hypothetical protein